MECYLMSNPNPTKDAVVQKYKTIATEYVENSHKIQQLQERQSVLEAMAQDCHATGRLFGFDVAAEAAAYQSGPAHSAPPALEKPRLALAKGKTIRELVIEQAREAHPAPVRANALKKTLEDLRGEELHDKTVGMTLYRLSKDGIMRREGWDWYFVPTEERIKVEDLMG